MIATLIPLSVIGGLAIGANYWRQQRQTAPLIAQLMPPVRTSVEATLVHKEQQASLDLFSTNQHLALSGGLVGITTLGRFGLPLLRIISLPGLLYLDLYFVGQAVLRWRATGRVGIETNDAVLVTGLLATRQLGAEALFATLFFTSHKLQEIVAAGVAQETTSGDLPYLTEAGAMPLAATAATLEQMSGWQQQIDRAALLLLALSAVSTPILGIHRSLSVLLANFGYDYRVFAPLSALNHLRLAKTQGIWIKDGHVFEQLGKVNVILIDGQQERVDERQHWRQLPAIKCRQVHACNSPAATQIMQWQAQGQQVAYVCTSLTDLDAIAQADLVIHCADPATSQEQRSGRPHVILHPDQPEQLQQLFALAAANEATQRRALLLAVVPSVANLWGIYLWHFDVIAALLVDYGGMGLGIFNAMMRPRLHQCGHGSVGGQPGGGGSAETRKP
ncbi:MAG: hypothetical protein KDE58_01930 [Caldilineaceae bacterium]|nr:hypothetical protein [Caldilineaceae bacterium]